MTALSIGRTLATAGIPTSMAIDASGSRAYVADATQNALYVFDLQTANAVAWIPTGRQPAQIALSGTRGYVSNFADRSITEFDATSARALKTLAVGAIGLAADPTSTRLYLAAGPRLVVLDTATDAEVAAVAAPVGSVMWGVVLEPVTRRLFVTDSVGSRVLVYDASTLASVGEVRLDAPARLGIATGGGKVFVSSYTDQAPQLTVIDAASLSVLSHKAAVSFGTSLVVDAQGAAYVASSVDRSVTSVPATGTTISRASFDPGRVPGVAALGPTGMLIAAVSGGAAPPPRPTIDPIRGSQP